MSIGYWKIIVGHFFRDETRIFNKKRTNTMSMIWGASLVTSSAALAMNNTTMAPDAGDLPYLLFRSTNRDLLSHLMHYFWSTWPFDGAKRFISVIWVQEIPTTFLVSCSFWWSSLFFVSYLRSGTVPYHISMVNINLELYVILNIYTLPVKLVSFPPVSWPSLQKDMKCMPLEEECVIYNVSIMNSNTSSETKRAILMVCTVEAII